jgi:hypothetical protein
MLILIFEQTTTTKERRITLGDDSFDYRTIKSSCRPSDVQEWPRPGPAEPKTEPDFFPRPAGAEPNRIY